jgi:hypothetical protein
VISCLADRYHGLTSSTDTLVEICVDTKSMEARTGELSV